MPRNGHSSGLKWEKQNKEKNKAKKVTLLIRLKVWSKQDSKRNFSADCGHTGESLRNLISEFKGKRAAWIPS